MEINKSCHSKFKDVIPSILEINPMSTTNLYGPVSRFVSDCITSQKCKCGMKGKERKDFEWQHDIRRVLDELKNENIIIKDSDIWHVTDLYYTSTERGEPHIDEFYCNESLKKLKDELMALTHDSPETEEYNGIRFKRDKLTISKLKKLRNYECQICHKSVTIKGGKRYVEGAHILEKRKGGPELPRNILILCPNHHKEFDYGDRSKIIRKGDLIEFELNGKPITISMKL